MGSAALAAAVCLTHVRRPELPTWDNEVLNLLLLLIAYVQRYSLLSSRLAALLSHIIMIPNELLSMAILNILRSGVLTTLFSCCMADAT